MKKGRMVIWMRVHCNLRGLILVCTTDFLCNWVLCNCLHPIFPVSADVTDRGTEKPNMLISWRTFVSHKIESALIADVVMSLYASEGKRVALVGNEEPVITIFHPSSKWKPHFVFSNQNIHVKSKGHAIHFETGHGHESESCMSQMNILPAKLLLWRVRGLQQETEDLYPAKISS